MSPKQQTGQSGASISNDQHASLGFTFAAKRAVQATRSELSSPSPFQPRNHCCPLASSCLPHRQALSRRTAHTQATRTPPPSSTSSHRDHTFRAQLKFALKNMSANSVYQLVYLSSATTLYNEDELLRILEVSRRNNSANDITGLLLYHEGNIIQFLEGEEGAVRSLYNKIESDPRHKGVLPLLQRRLPKRDFGQWSMGFKNVALGQTDQIEGFTNLMSSIAGHTVADPTMSKEVQRLIRSYRSVIS